MARYSVSYIGGEDAAPCGVRPFKQTVLAVLPSPQDEHLPDPEHSQILPAVPP